MSSQKGGMKQEIVVLLQPGRTSEAGEGLHSWDRQCRHHAAGPEEFGKGCSLEGQSPEVMQYLYCDI